MTENNSLVSGILREQFRLEMMVPQISKKEPKTSEGLTVSFPLSIQDKQENMKDRISRNRRVGLKNTVTHQRQIPGQHLGAGRSPIKISEEGETLNTVGEEHQRRRKEKVVFPIGGGEATNPENMEALYASVRSWGM